MKRCLGFFFCLFVFVINSVFYCLFVFFKFFVSGLDKYINM